MKQSFMKTLIILTLGLIIGLAGCNHDPADEITLTAITLDTTNVKKVFTVGDEFTTEGLVVTAVYSDETTKEVTGWTVSETDLSKPAEKQTITISYTEDEKTVTATYTIEVKDKAAADPDDPEKKDPENKDPEDSGNKDPDKKDPENTPPVKATFEITYETQFDNVPSKKVDEGYKLTAEDLPALSKTGYAFCGWNKKVGDEIKADTKITATWKKINSSFQITLATDNELDLKITVPNTDTFVFEAPEGYKSYAWYLNGSLEEEKTNKYSIFKRELARADISYKYEDGIYEILVIVEDANGEYNSAKASFIISN